MEHSGVKGRTWVVDTDASVIVEDVIAEEGAPVNNEDALRKDRSKDHDLDNRGREVDGIVGREDDSSIDDSKEDAALQVAVEAIVVEACKQSRVSDRDMVIKGEKLRKEYIACTAAGGQATLFSRSSTIQAREKHKDS